MPCLRALTLNSSPVRSRSHPEMRGRAERPAGLRLHRLRGEGQAGPKCPTGRRGGQGRGPGRGQNHKGDWLPQTPQPKRVLFPFFPLLTIPCSPSQVNGSLVSTMSHQEVVKLIKCESAPNVSGKTQIWFVSNLRCPPQRDRS